MAELKQFFSESALWHIAEIIEGRYNNDLLRRNPVDYKSLKQFLSCTGLKVEDVPLPHDNQIYSLLKEAQVTGDTKGPDCIIRVVEHLCNPEEFIGEADQFGIIKERINALLRYYCLQVSNTGKVLQQGRTEIGFSNYIGKDKVRRTAEQERLSKATNMDIDLFDTREFHPEVQKHGRLHFIEGHYLHTIFECCKAFDRYVSKKANSSESGSKLMQGVLSPNSSKGLRLNTLQTETEKNEQLGLMQLCVGLMFIARNPGGHEPELDYPITKQDALDLLSLISFLYRQIDETTPV